MSARFGLEIRATTPDDAAGLAELFQDCGLPSASTRLADRIEVLRRTPGVCLIAWSWGPPSGVVVTSWRASLTANRLVGRIDLLLVRPDARRRGIGRLLLKAAAQAARTAGCDTIGLAASSDHAGLAAFCAATGFASTGTTDWVRPLRKK